MVLAKENTDEEDDQFLRQLKRTQASVTVWELLLASEKNRTALTKALSVLKLRGETIARLCCDRQGWRVESALCDDTDGAYDDSKRNVIGVFKTMVKVGL
ncbi:hypothetical protein GH714_040369 [Hevea brasiliensis]|uniref:Uncharacterized protein n=1 Tax=Hevea brasiliensis TaxID=3981 RepID=A0A6A6K8W8_HEVBR|nr:hypothetical protein GH714_040369 [Hevea brasiliensis]